MFLEVEKVILLQAEREVSVKHKFHSLRRTCLTGAL